MRRHLVSYANSSADGHMLMCILRIMPLALIPRPWDFPDPPKVAEPSAEPSKSVATDAKAPPPEPTPAASGEKAAPPSSSPPPEAASGSPPAPAPAGNDTVPEVANPVPDSA